MNIKRITFIGSLVILLFALPLEIFAQISAGGEPFSFKENAKQSFQGKHSQASIPTVTTPLFDLQKAKKEDEKLNGTVRFAAPIDVNYSIHNNGQWIDLENGDRIWQLKIKSETALGLFVVYENFYLPEGSTFFVYSENHQQVFGAYTNRNNKKSGQFMTGMVKGETAILEYYQPKTVTDQASINISRLYHAYEPDFIQPDTEFQTYSGFGSALPCHVNVNCTEGDDWQDHKRGVVRMLRVFDEGIGWCSGSLINNTNQDATPYVLSAYHCIAGFTPQLDLWRFDFNFESPNCNNPAAEPTYQSILGCSYRSGREESDFLLLELSEDVPSTYNPYFNGWDRDDVNSPQTSTIISHPQGDIKKITKDNDPSSIYPNSIFWSNSVTTPANHHFVLNMDVGTIENGSSGSSLFNEDGLITGQLHGGNASCSTFTAYFGRFSKSWDEGITINDRLKEWLDPLNNGTTTIAAYEPPAVTYGSISGTISTGQGQAIGQVQVNLTGDVSASQTTSADGTYSFTNIPEGGNYTITLSKTIDSSNGLTGFDLVIIQQHILNVQTLTDPSLLIAADLNNTGDITAFDLVHLRQQVLAITTEFANVDSWKFLTNNSNVNSLNGNVTLDFVGIKMGDLNYSADPED